MCFYYVGIKDHQDPMVDIIVDLLLVAMCVMHGKEVNAKEAATAVSTTSRVVVVEEVCIPMVRWHGCTLMFCQLQ